MTGALPFTIQLGDISLSGNAIVVHGLSESRSLGADILKQHCVSMCLELTSYLKQGEVIAKLHEDRGNCNVGTVGSSGVPAKSGVVYMMCAIFAVLVALGHFEWSTALGRLFLLGCIDPYNIICRLLFALPPAFSFHKAWAERYHHQGC